MQARVPEPPFSKASGQVSAPPMDKSLHPSRPQAKSVHSSNTDRSGQTQGGNSPLDEGALDVALASDKSVTTPLDRLADALADVSCFEQVGAKSFDVSLVGEVMGTGERDIAGFWGSVPVSEFRESLPQMLDRCGRVRLNLIVRPRAPGLRLVQLDDLDAVKLEKVQRRAFRAVETSPGSYQAWLCLRGTDEEIERELKRVIGADTGANGATRLAGSLNVKECYQEAGYPVVRLDAARGRVVDVAELRDIGMIASSGKPPCVPSVRRAPIDREVSLPDYGEFVRNARLTATGEVDRSAVDYAWAATALKRGQSVEAVMMELERVSLKAAGLPARSRRAYVRRTVSKAQRSLT